MKNINKFFYFLSTIIFVCFIGISKVDAVKISIDGKDKVSVNKQIDITYTVSEYSSVPGTMEINYDRSLLRCDSKCYDSKKIEGNMTFTSTYTALKDGDAVITVTSNYPGGDASKKIIIGVGSTTTTTTNTTTNSTTTSSSTSTATTTTTTSAKSNNANLKSLSVLDNNNKEVVYSPVFSPDIYEYNATVDSSVSSISIIAPLEHDKANVIIDSSDSLVPGENNKIAITVTAEDGTKKVYVLNVKREALDGNSLLSTLTIEEYPNLEFKSDVFFYTIKVDESVKKLSIKCATSSDTSIVTISDNENLKDGSKVKILVKAEDGSKREYTLKISTVKEEIKKEEKVEYSTERNPIIIMILSIIAFSLIGAIIHVIRKK